MDFAVVLRQRRTLNRSVVAKTYPPFETPEERKLLSVSAIDVVGHLPPAAYNTYIANAVTFQGNVFKDWGNEPFVAVNQVNPNQIVVSSFAYGAYVFTFPGDTRSSLWYSQDGGATWDIRFPIPTLPVPTEGVPDDQTFAYDSKGVLHGAFLTYGLTRTGPSLNIFHGTTTDPNLGGVGGRPASVWQWNTNHVNLPNPTQDKADQPWIAVSGSQVYVGYGFAEGKSIQSRVSVSSDGGATFTMDNPISNARVSYFVNSGIRLATDQVGNVYSLFATADPSLKEIKAGEPQSVHYRLNMSSDGGATRKYTRSTREGGLVVDDGLSLQVPPGSASTVESDIRPRVPRNRPARPERVARGQWGERGPPQLDGSPTGSAVGMEDPALTGRPGRRARGLVRRIGRPSIAGSAGVLLALPTS
jgi:hypothetical protein